jgi:hypothetical protein
MKTVTVLILASTCLACAPNVLAENDSSDDAFDDEFGQAFDSGFDDIEPSEQTDTSIVDPTVKTTNALN